MSNLWEDNRYLALVMAGFFLLLAVAYFAVLAPNASKRGAIEAAFEKETAESRGAFFRGTVRMADAIDRYAQGNTLLQQRFGELEKRLSRPYLRPLLTERQMAHRQSEVRLILGALRLELQKKAGARNVLLSEKAADLGLNLPESLTETIEQDISWLEQMHAAADFADLLIANADEMREGRNRHYLLGIPSLEPKPPRDAGAQPHFIKEYPVEVEMLVSLTGLARILEAIARPESFFALHEISVMSGGGKRVTEVRQVRTQELPDSRKVITKENEHYYTVRLNVARMETVTLDPSKDIAPKTVPGDGEKKPYTPKAF